MGAGNISIETNATRPNVTNATAGNLTNVTAANATNVSQGNVSGFNLSSLNFSELWLPIYDEANFTKE